MLDKACWVVKWDVNRVRHVEEMAAAVEGTVVMTVVRERKVVEAGTKGHSAGRERRGARAGMGAIPACSALAAAGRRHSFGSGASGR
jgi:hypothetical protein